MADHVDFRTVILRHGARHYEKAPGKRPDRPFAPPPWTFAIEGEELALHLPPEEELPDPLVLTATVQAGRSVGGVWHVDSGNVTGAGLPLWPGIVEEVRCDVPPDSRLRLLLKRSAIPRARRPEAPPRLEVLWEDDQQRFTRSFELTDDDETGTWIECELPPAGGSGVRLGFVVRGSRGMCVAYEPTLGPREPGRQGERPWESRPDVVLVLTDTFRADNLSAYGGEGRTPELDRWVERSLRFRQARSTATWTLPALSSLFTATQPPEHGAVGPGRSLAEDFHTLSEHLRSHGYRTVAVTDSFFASRRYGLAQGFSWFREIPTAEWSLARTLREARRALERDDGRPVFLFVHTYRAHKPFRVGEDEDRTAFDTLVREVETRAGGSRPGAALSRAYREQAGPFSELYAEGVRDLDRRMAAWLGELEGLGLFEEGLCVITSDHGESFDEHGEMFHRLPPWEEQIRVPLILIGDRVLAGEAPGNASIVDVPRTLSRYCGLEAPRGWGGRALLSDGAGELAFAFQMGPDAGRFSRMCVVRGDRKLFFEFDGEAPRSSRLRFAYDLAADPHETRDCSGEAWAQEARQALLGELEALARRRFEPGSVELGARERAGLDELGYTGDDESP